MLTAGAGCGKTIALEQALALARRRPVAALPPADSDPGTLLRRLVTLRRGGAGRRRTSSRSASRPPRSASTHESGGPSWSASSTGCSRRRSSSLRRRRGAGEGPGRRRPRRGPGRADSPVSAWPSRRGRAADAAREAQDRAAGSRSWVRRPRVHGGGMRRARPVAGGPRRTRAHCTRQPRAGRLAPHWAPPTQDVPSLRGAASAPACSSSSPRRRSTACRPASATRSSDSSITHELDAAVRGRSACRRTSPSSSRRSDCRSGPARACGRLAYHPLVREFLLDRLERNGRRTSSVSCTYASRPRS